MVYVKWPLFHFLKIVCLPCATPGGVTRAAKISKSLSLCSECPSWEKTQVTIHHTSIYLPPTTCLSLLCVEETAGKGHTPCPPGRRRQHDKTKSMTKQQRPRSPALSRPDCHLAWRWGCEGPDPDMSQGLCCRPRSQRGTPAPLITALLTPRNQHLRLFTQM